MSFSSVQFLFAFLPLAWAAYYLLPPRVRNAVLAVFSLVFVIWAGWRGTAILLAFTAFNWAAGLLIGRASRKRALLTAAVVCNLAALGFFKYAGFVTENINALLPGALPVLSVAMPLGISFYTFQGISYCVDTARGDIAPTRNPLRFFLYMAFFAHVSSGPILRWSDQQTALDPRAPGRRVDAARFCNGIQRFTLGLAKKALLADPLGSVYAAVNSAPAQTLPAPVLFAGATAFFFQLYYDFSGYSDMAVGLGEMFGLTMPENFDYPYLSRTVGEFWRRWHMTLGAWFRRYLYFPLGGSRCSLGRTCLNLFVVFLCTGIWHGAAWQYVAFGVWHGLLACAERLGLARRLEKLPGWVSHVYLVAAVWIGFVFFGANGLGQALAALRGMFTLQAGNPGMTFAAFVGPKEWLLFAAAVLFCGPLQAIFPRLRSWARDGRSPRPLTMALLAVLLFFSIVQVTAGNYQAFIYAQF